MSSSEQNGWVRAPSTVLNLTPSGCISRLHNSAVGAPLPRVLAMSHCIQKHECSVKIFLSHCKIF